MGEPECNKGRDRLIMNGRRLDKRFPDGNEQGIGKMIEEKYLADPGFWGGGWLMYVHTCEMDHYLCPG